MSNFTKIRPAGFESFRADRHDEANNRFSQFCERARNVFPTYKNLFLKMSLRITCNPQRARDAINTVSCCYKKKPDPVVGVYRCNWFPVLTVAQGGGKLNPKLRIETCLIAWILYATKNVASNKKLLMMKHLNVGKESITAVWNHRHNHHHMSVMDSGHLLTRSGLTYLDVSYEVFHDSFCQLWGG